MTSEKPPIVEPEVHALITKAGSYKQEYHVMKKCQDFEIWFCSSSEQNRRPCMLCSPLPTIANSLGSCSYVERLYLIMAPKAPQVTRYHL